MRAGAAAAVVLAAAAASACSSSKASIDATKPADAKVFDDARPIDAKVFMDAAIPSTVKIVANCTGIGAGDIGVTITTDDAADRFSDMAPTITAGQYVKFMTAGGHNFENQPGAAAASLFKSAAPGPQTTCLQFTVGGGVTYPFQCDVHGFMGMVGTLTVN